MPLMAALLPSRPKYQQLKQALTRQIGRQAPGDRIASENELVRDFGVSKHTVLKALTELVNEGVLYRQQGRGTFVAARTAPENGAPADAPAGAIGVVMPLLGEDPALTPAFRILAGVSQQIESAATRRHVLFRNSTGDPEKEAAQIDELRHAGASGVLLYPAYDSSHPTLDALQRLREARIPFVVIDHQLAAPEAVFVGTDDRAGAIELVRHLIERGHTRIAHVTLPENWFASSTPAHHRAEGYRKALQAAGLPFNERWVAHRTGEDCATALEQLLRDEPRPTAIFAVDAFTCIRLYHAIRARGLRIPEDVALAGFDDIPTAALLDVPLTMMEQHFSRIGALAAEQLRLRIETGAPGLQAIRLTPALRARRSTGA
jgi:GntR family transcriptional regulator of arabinose operon